MFIIKNAQVLTQFTVNLLHRKQGSCLFDTYLCTLCLKKNVLTLKRYSSKLQGAILMKFGRNIQNTLE